MSSPRQGVCQVRFSWSHSLLLVWGGGLTVGAFGHPAMSPLPLAMCQQQCCESTDLFLKSGAISQTRGAVHTITDSEILAPSPTS